MQLKLFTEEMVPSVNGCLNPYMFFPLEKGVMGRFSDPFTNNGLHSSSEEAE